MMLVETDFNSAVYATLGAMVAGAAIKFAGKLFDRNKDRLQEHLILRKELREELDTVKNELRALQETLAEWRQKYYDQVDVNNTLKLDVLKITDELNEYKRISGIHPSSNGWFDNSQ